MILDRLLPSGLRDSHVVAQYNWPPHSDFGSEGYSLVTPTINEQGLFLNVIAAVVGQTERPVLWVILDSSPDRFVRKYLADHEASLPPTILLERPFTGYDWLEYGTLVSGSISFCISIMREIGRVWNYIAVLDADMAPDKGYFEKLCARFNAHGRLGVASGLVLVCKHSKWTPEWYSSEPRGGARMYRTQALIEIGGFPSTPSPDTVSDIKLRMKGWNTEIVENARCYALRETFAASQPVQAAINFGRGRYMLDLHPAYVPVAAGIFARRHGIAGGIGFLLGYCGAYLSGTQKIQDPDVRNHFRNSWKSKPLKDSFRAFLTLMGR